MDDASRLHLREVTDQHFAWLLGETDAPDDLTEPPGGVDDSAVLTIIRRLTADLHSAGCRSHWLIVNSSEIFGFCGFKNPPNSSGEAEIGYDVAASRRGQCIATRAIALMLQQVCDYERISKVMAKTAEDNPASQLVLERNGFVHAGRWDGTEDGTVICWAKALPC